MLLWRVMEPLSDDGRKVLKRAKRNWILLGVFGWGLTMFVITTVNDYHHHRDIFLFNAPNIFKSLALLAGWLVMGYVWGLGMWRHSNKRPRKFPPSSS